MSTARGMGTVVGFAMGGAVFIAVLGPAGLGATPARIAEATGSTPLVSGVLAVVATLVFMSQPLYEQGVLDIWMREEVNTTSPRSVSFW